MNYLTSNTDFDRFFDSFFRTKDGHRDAVASLPVRTSEEEDKYILKAELPGLNEDNIKVEFHDGNMTIEASYEERKENDNVLTFRSGKFIRTFDVRDVDQEKVNAQLKDGILTIELPKKEEAKPHRVLIKSA
jgi:HSP20 family protein